jgi:probable HAF family extracellular repeat protein
MRYNMVALLVVAVVLIIAGSAKALEYQITIIEPTGYAMAYSLNDYGQVTGYVGDDSFVWEDGVMTIIEKPAGDERIIARAINNHGQVTGELRHPISAALYIQAFLWENGVLTGLGSLHSDNMTKGYGINNAGIVVGQANKSNGIHVAVMWDNVNSVVAIDTIENTDYSIARSINDSNEVVGEFSTSSHGRHAFIYDDVNGMRDIGVLPDQVRSYGYAINNQSQVVGYSAGSPDGYHAFLYNDSNGVMTDLGTMDGAVDSAAYDISDRGVIVGRSIWADDSSKGCLWVCGQIIDVNDLLYTDLDWTIIQAISISNNGQIVGTGVLDGQKYAILLTPIGHLDYDNDVDLKDFAIFSSSWGRSNCNDLNNWCGNADINRNGEVDLPDLGKLTEHWLEGIE